MEIQWALVVHGLVTVLVVISFLCGQWPIFQGTFVERIHRFLTYGAYDYFLRGVVLVCGSRGRNAVLKVEDYCCERPNPILQVLYLGILGGTYYIFASTSFRYIPGYYVSEWHRYISTMAVFVGILLFFLASFSDPGTVNAENISQYLAAYPYDKVIYVEKMCQTCKIPKPARSKHCGICNRCVARFDHHCGWLNNCIGEKNTRYFMAFLLCHLFICLYGAVVLVMILVGELKEHKVIYLLTAYYGIEESFSTLFPPVIQWLLNSYNKQILIIVFLAVISSLLIGFFGYHAHLCVTNTTTNETFKWQEYISWKAKVNEARASSAALKASIHAMDGEGKAPESKCRSFFRKSPLQHEEPVIKNNIYDKGMLSNVFEIVFPLSERRSFFRRKTS